VQDRLAKVNLMTGKADVKSHVWTRTEKNRNLN